MQFLCEEISVKNVLFLTEYTQFVVALNLTQKQVCLCCDVDSTQQLYDVSWLTGTIFKCS